MMVTQQAGTQASKDLSMTENTSVILARRPRGNPQPQDFRLDGSPIPDLGVGQFLLKNHYISLDAGFLNWMKEGCDHVMPAMPLDKPVTGQVLGEVQESPHEECQVGEWTMARLAWQQYSLVDDKCDFIAKIDREEGYPIDAYLVVLGDTGLSAYFGMMDIGQPCRKDTVVVSAAGGAVGSIAGQVAAILGARVVGIAGGQEKCHRLKEELGYHATINRRLPLEPQITELVRAGLTCTLTMWAERCWKPC